MKTIKRMKGIPALSELAPRCHARVYDPDEAYEFRYRSKHHRELPHVVKFSGGRSSGMLLFTPLENGFLRQDRATW